MTHFSISYYSLNIFNISCCTNRVVLHAILVPTPDRRFTVTGVRPIVYSEVELGIFTLEENVKITPYHKPIIKYSAREIFSNN
jgi:hypothetical protein